MEADAYLELEVKIKFSPLKAEPATRHYPGDLSSLEIHEITLGEVVLPQEVFDEVIKQCGLEIEEACWEATVEEEASNAQEYERCQEDWREDR